MRMQLEWVPNMLWRWNPLVSLTIPFTKPKLHLQNKCNIHTEILCLKVVKTLKVKQEQELDLIANNESATNFT